MPGILPMKVIKCGNASHSRIAQACDRCRSKKIRCDGTTPCCSHCAAVGFECKTSDKLSRRAYPRGYTENLEEQVRQLELENRELKGLLDEKEEKIDMIQRVQSRPIARQQLRESSATLSVPSHCQRDSCSTSDKEKLHINRISSLTVSTSQETNYSGMSSVKSLVHAYARKQFSGPDSQTKPDLEAIFPHVAPHRPRRARSSSYRHRLGRVDTDRLINVYFQELAPTLPLFHQPTVLKTYAKFDGCGDDDLDVRQYAQLYLIFSVAAISMQDSLDDEVLAELENKWTTAMNEFEDDWSLINVQCRALAALYHLKQRNYSTMSRVLGHAVAMSSTIGLHADLANDDSNLILVQCRRRTFWTLFAIDSFAAAHTGAPPLMSISSAQCSLPYDVDDESIMITEITPSLPGAPTRISSALALYKLAKLLSDAVNSLYPAVEKSQVSISAVCSLEDALKSWLDALPTHLKLQFEQDKPSTRIVSDRSPILSLAYQYVTILVVKAIILATDPPHDRYMSALFTVAAASKRTIQILDLLEERNMSFVFTLSKDDVLMQAMFGLLWQCSELKCSGSLLQDSIKLCKHASGKLSRHRITASEQIDLCLEALASSSEDGRRISTNVVKLSALDYTNEGSQIEGNLPSQAVYTTRADPTHQLASSIAAKSSSPEEHHTFQIAVPSLRSEASNLTDDQSQVQYHTARRESNTLRNSVFEEQIHPTAPHYQGQDPRNWLKMLSELNDGHENIFDRIYGGQIGDCYTSPSVSPVQMASYPPLRLLGAPTMNQSSWSSTGAVGSRNNLQLAEVIRNNMSGGQASSASPPLIEYGDTAFAIMMPDKSTPSSLNDFESTWLSELDPLCGFVP